ncbi:MAG: 2Fe-2S iron-sulfur cluster-binding protein [Methylocystis sp.]|uniref:2Fe-2S iron-sulfur cluster-binding protein n=1 Tax=Methylocystis sp. TaxID=1911079 RepID=UPI003DA5B79B
MSIALDIADNSVSPLEPETPFLRVEDRNGVVHALAAVEGWRLMEILRDYGMGMDNTCGGALACAECHVVLDPESAARVPAPREEELEKLDELPMLYDHSRLSCQIIWSDEMSGLTLKLPQET